MLIPLDYPPPQPNGATLREAFDAAKPIRVTMDLGPGQLPIIMELVPDEADSGALSFVGKVDSPYGLTKTCRIALVGTVRLTLAGSKGWPQPEGC